MSLVLDKIDALVLDKDYKKGDKGENVKLIQEWLCLNGIELKIDKDYGVITETAVMVFQQDKGLFVTGVVDEMTFDYLVSPMRRALSSECSTRPMSEMVIKYAKQHLEEHPREVGGENRGPWVRLYMDEHDGDRYLWCAGFVCFILGQASESVELPMPVTKSFSCDALANDAKRRGIFVSEDDASPADITPGSIFLKRKSAGDWTHTGLVIQAHEDGFETIEGNTNDDGSRDGYEVCRRVRPYKNYDFIVFE